MAIAGTASLRGCVWIQRAAVNGGSVFPFVTSDEPPPPLSQRTGEASGPITPGRSSCRSPGSRGFFHRSSPFEPRGDGRGVDGRAGGGNDIRVMDACLTGEKQSFLDADIAPGKEANWPF